MYQPFKILIILFAAIVALSGCASDKIWGGNIVTIDDESEVEKGTAQHERILAQVGTYKNTELARYIDAIGEKIAVASDRPKLRWHFTVLDLEIPNAFATQGGYVYITRGMLALLQSETELAAILAHETAHICARDTPQAERVGNMMGLGVLGVLVAAPALILFPQVAAAPAAAGMASISRKNEINADKLGTQYLFRAGYPPESMATTMEILANMEAYEHDRQKVAGRNPSGWWHRIYASHPTTETRQEKLTENANVPGAITDITPQPEFLARLNSLEIGSSKFEGIPYKDKRYFSQWKIALKTPEGWFAHMNEARAQFWLVRPDRKAQLQMEKTSSINIEQPCETLQNLMKPSPVTDTKPLVENDLLSCAGLVHKSSSTLFGRHEEVFRAGVIAESKAAGLGYIFRGYADKKEFSENDLVFLSVARSIETIKTTDVQPKPFSLKIRRAKTGETFASIASSSRFSGNNAENLLRLLNRRYPNGEPKAGELIKIVE